MFQPVEQPDKCASQTNVLHASACEAAMLRAPVSGVLTDDVITECESPPPTSQWQAQQNFVHRLTVTSESLVKETQDDLRRIL